MYRIKMLVVMLLIAIVVSCNSSDDPGNPNTTADTITYNDSYGYTWSCPNNGTSVDECQTLGFECGQICDPLRGFDAIDIEASGTCEDENINALRETGSCIYEGLNISCNSSGQIIATGGGVNIQTGFYNTGKAKFYCQNNPNDISDRFPQEANLIFE